MDNYQSSLFFGIIAIVLLAVFSLVLANIMNNRGKFKVKNSTKKRVSSSQVNRVMIGGGLAKKLNESAKQEAKYKMETKILNAGFSFTYGEYKLCCILIAIFVPILVFLFTSNIYISIVLGVVGFFAPAEIIKYIGNKRITKLEDQIGSFMRLVLERYKTSKDMASAIVNTLADFRDCEPLFTEIKLTIVDINLGIPCADAIDNLARRTGNKFMARFGNYYRITDNLSTFSAKVELLNQAYQQYTEDIELKRMLKKEISGPVGESYLMVGMTPVFMVWQSFQDPTYLDFILHDTYGQIGIAAIFVILLGCVIFINIKIGGPLE